MWSRFDVEDMPLRDFLEYFHREHGLEVTLVSGNMAMLYADFMPPKKKEERLPMRLRELVEHVTKKPVEPHVRHLSIEIMADDLNGEDVEVPTVSVRIK